MVPQETSAHVHSALQMPIAHVAYKQVHSTSPDSFEEEFVSLRLVLSCCCCCVAVLLQPICSCSLDRRWDCSRRTEGRAAAVAAVAATTAVQPMHCWLSICWCYRCCANVCLRHCASNVRGRCCRPVGTVYLKRMLQAKE
jgi:hypothetical protein